MREFTKAQQKKIDKAIDNLTQAWKEVLEAYGEGDRYPEWFVDRGLQALEEDMEDQESKSKHQE